jgi:hypothetical protein
MVDQNAKGKTLAELKVFAEAGRALAFVTEGSNPFGYFVRRFRDGTYSFTGRFPQQGARVPKILISGGMATYEDLINEAKNAFLEDVDLPAWSVMSESVRYCAGCGVPTERLMYCQWCDENRITEKRELDEILGDIEIDL